MLIYGVVGADANLIVIELSFVVVGIGLALNTGPVVGVAVSAVASDLAGLASGIANLARMSGATLGVAVQGSVLAVVGRNASHGPQFVSGLRAAVIVGCVVEFAGAVLAFRGVSRKAQPAAPTDQSPRRAAAGSRLAAAEQKN
jgi:DHA2 family methylenomycin A resistance protein-like MFS transporter